MASSKVSVYIRKPGSRERERATNKNTPPGSIFCLRYVRAGKRAWETLDVNTFSAAQKAAIDRNVDLVVGRVVPVPEPRPEPPKPKPTLKTSAVPLAEAIDQYHEKVMTRSGKTVSAYAFTLSQFYKSIQGKKRFVQDVTVDDLLAFVRWLRATHVGNRTIYNRLSEVGAFLRASGVRGVKEMIAGAQVRYVEKIVKAYREDELKALFAAAKPEEWILFQFYLATGAREREVQFAEWDSIDFVAGIFTVKQTGPFTPKDFSEREVPIPDFLVAALKQRMLHSTGRLIFPTPSGKPNGHMLRQLKALAKRAGLVGNFELHKFRKSYATLQHRAGVDARTIQLRLGHEDLKTTLAYLEGEETRSAQSREQANAFSVFA